MKKTLRFTKITYELMKFSFIQIVILGLFCSLTYAYDAVGQEFLKKQVSVHINNANLKDAINIIEQETGVKFVYSRNIIDANTKITVNSSNEKLNNVLANIFNPIHIKYEIVGKRIVLSKAYETIKSPNVETLSRINLTAVENISGSVQSASGENLIGVSILLKGSNKGAVTDVNGKFSINAQKGDVLVFSFIGYQSQEYVVTENNIINIILKESANNLSEVAVVGSRFSKPRTDVDRPVAIDVINAKEIQQSGQVDLGQAITYAAPSFSATKFGINDAAPFVDPATLRGLGPDQVLVLVNNKRRHKVSFLSINDGVGKGQVGTDINVVPMLSLKRVEVLRDGAAAIYGSDAIAGVINMELNDASSGGAVNVYVGNGYTKPNLDVSGAIAPKLITDGLTYNMAANFGLKLTPKGFFNTTITYSHTNGYDRSGTYKSSAGYYVKDPVKDAALIAQNGINLDRAILGAAENTTYGAFINSGIKLNNNWNFYAFGGYTHKHVITGVFTRPPSNTKRNDLTIFPNGYNPVAPADLQDFSITAGIKGNLGNGWKSDFSINQGSNKVDWYAENTVNPSMGASSPTSFYVGQTKVTQSLLNADIAKMFNGGGYPNFNFGMGTEIRYETFGQKAGDPASYEAGPLKLTKDIGSSGREGFSDKSAGSWNRTNVGIYMQGESDITKNFLLGAAIRGENYSDFGSDFSYKLNSRIKIADPFSIRASVSRGFRAPSMVQAHYSNYINISFDNAGNSIINPVIPATSDLAALLGVNGLKKETSFDMSMGITSKIGNNFTFTADVYQIDVFNRIMLSGSIDVSKIPQFVAAGFPQTANVFVNAIDTRTKGLELVASYNNNIGAKSKIGFNLAYSSMHTTLKANRTTSTGIVVADDIATKFITDGLPKDKFIGTINYDYSKVGFMVRFSRFGQVTDPTAPLAVTPIDPNVPNYQVFTPKNVVDISFKYRATNKMTIMLGVNNLFDVYPDLLQKPQTSNEVIFSRRTNQFGTQGRFLNMSFNYNF